MQTFLPYPDMIKSLQALDYRRLGKQRVETMQLIKSIIQSFPEQVEHIRPGVLVIPETPNKGWVNHPARTQWEQHVGALALYHDMSILAWKMRGYNNTMPFLSTRGKHKLPDWWGDEQFHSSHRSNLLRKDPVWYGKFGWSDDPEAEYYWPSRDPKYQLQQ